MCARFFNDLLKLHITRGVHGQAVGHTFYEHVRPDGAQNKRLIWNTDPVYIFWLPGAWILKPVHPVCACFSQHFNRYTVSNTQINGRVHYVCTRQVLKINP